MEFESLETNRLLLKKITPEVFRNLYANLSESEIKKLLGLETHEEFLKEKAKSDGGYTTHNKTILAFLMVSKETGETIGRCGFHNWYNNYLRAELGYMIHKDENKRKGFMTEALKPILKYGFENMNLNRIEAFIGPTNIASKKLIKKYGFTQEGYLRQHYIRNGEIQDSFIFSLLKEEYQLFK